MTLALKWRTIVVTLAIVAAAGCKTQSSTADEDTSAPANPTMIVTAARAERAPMQSELRVLGNTRANADMIVRAPASGRVTGIALRVGDMVRKGQVIAHIVNREDEAAEAGLAVARRINPADADALGQSVQRYSRGPGIAVVAPGSGIVAKPAVTSGQMVADLDPIVDLVNPANIYVAADVPISATPFIKTGMDAVVTSPLHPGLELPARVAAMIPSFDASSATAPVRLEFAGAHSITELDAPVEIRIMTAHSDDATTIPTAALFQDSGAGEFHVFKIGADGRAHRTSAKVGIRSGDRVEITSGVAPGDVVITSGGYALSDGLLVKVAQAGQ